MGVSFNFKNPLIFLCLFSIKVDNNKGRKAPSKSVLPFKRLHVCLVFEKPQFKHKKNFLVR